MNEVTKLKIKEILKQIERIKEAWASGLFARIYPLPQYVKFKSALESRVDKLLELCPSCDVNLEDGHTCRRYSSPVYKSPCLVKTGGEHPTACILKQVDTNKFELREL